MAAPLIFVTGGTGHLGRDLVAIVRAAECVDEPKGRVRSRPQPPAPFSA